MNNNLRLIGLMLSRNEEERGYLEIAIRGVYIDGYEHFLYEHLKKEYMDEFLEKFDVFYVIPTKPGIQPRQ